MVDAVEIWPNGLICLVTNNEDGTQHRESRFPGSNISDLTAEQQAEVNAVWTPDFVSQWRATNFPAPAFSDLAAAKSAEIDAAYAAHWTAPFAYDFGQTDTQDDDGASLGPAGAQTLQMRDDVDHPDQKNWISVATNATLALLAGQPADIIKIKATSNAWIMTTAQQLAVIMPLMADRQAKVLTAYGKLKTALKAAVDASDAAALAAIDPNSGWPA